MENPVLKYINNLQVIQHLSEATKAAMVLTDVKGKIIYLNLFAKDMYGLTEVDIAYENYEEWFTVYHPDGKTLMAKKELPIFKVLVGEEIKDYEITVRTHQDKVLRHYIVNGSQVKDENDRLQGVFMIAVDITEQRLMQKRLKDSAENYRQLTEKNPAPIFIHRQGVILYANPSCC